MQRRQDKYERGQNHQPCPGIPEDQAANLQGHENDGGEDDPHFEKFRGWPNHEVWHGNFSSRSAYCTAGPGPHFDSSSDSANFGIRWVAHMKRKISLTINGTPFVDAVEPRLLLIHYLRDV